MTPTRYMNTRLAASVASILALLVLLLALTWPRTNESVTMDLSKLLADNENVLVRCQVFSGLPAPEWPLSDLVRSQVVSAVSKLQQSPRPVTPLPSLGYRGFELRIGSTDNEVSLWILGDSVRVRHEGKELFFVDTSNQLEHVLVESARGELDSTVLDLIQETVESRSL